MCLRKPTKEFLLAYKKYNEKFDDAKLILDALSMTPNMRKFIEDNNIQNIKFQGYASNIKEILKDDERMKSKNELYSFKGSFSLEIDCIK